MQTYYGKIRLKSGGHPINVTTEASNNSAAKKNIEAQYSGQIDSWAKQMSTSPN
ncbi:hypothetical protein ACRASX_08715 [Flavobacterium sp. TMP13]|uniref:hypothetical protein n=1 Tax=Flavobacterium sp. TMP13 TaxID=3425950 RepID=UPI003D7889F8